MTEDQPAVAELDTSSAFNCPRCVLGVPQGFTFCPRCRAVGEGREYDPAEVDEYERHYVISLVALSLGAFAVPRLLRSHAFSTGAKVFWAVVGFSQTTASFGILYLVLTLFPAYLKAQLSGR